MSPFQLRQPRLHGGADIVILAIRRNEYGPRDSRNLPIVRVKARTREITKNIGDSQEQSDATFGFLVRDSG